MENTNKQQASQHQCMEFAHAWHAINSTCNVGYYLKTIHTQLLETIPFEKLFMISLFQEWTYQIS